MVAPNYYINTLILGRLAFIIPFVCDSVDNAPMKLSTASSDNHPKVKEDKKSNFACYTDQKHNLYLQKIVTSPFLRRHFSI